MVILKIVSCLELAHYNLGFIQCYHKMVEGNMRAQNTVSNHCSDSVYFKQTVV